MQVTPAGVLTGSPELVDAAHTPPYLGDGEGLCPAIPSGPVASVGRTLSQLDLRGSVREADTIAGVVDYAASVPKGIWIFGQGGEEDLWNKKQPTWDALSAQVPDQPVLLYGKHGFVVRPSALALVPCEGTD